jgi:hypothetical protein
MVRYKPSQFTKRELELMVSALVPAAGLDFLTGGALNKYTRKGAIKVAKTVGSLALRGGVPIATSIAGSAARAAIPLVTNPYLAGTALGLGALQTQPGQQLLDAAAQSGVDTRRSLDMALFNIQAKGEERVKKTKSKFNKAIASGMKTVKASASYGKKGIISSPKKAFSAVVKTASSVKRTGKVAKSGIRRKIGLAIRKLL